VYHVRLELRKQLSQGLGIPDQFSGLGHRAFNRNRHNPHASVVTASGGLSGPGVGDPAIRYCRSYAHSQTGKRLELGSVGRVGI
jgi:hypothetical protein